MGVGQKNAQSAALGCSPAGRGTTWVDRGDARAAVARARVPYRGVTPHPSLADTLKDLGDQAKYGKRANEQRRGDARKEVERQIRCGAENTQRISRGCGVEVQLGRPTTESAQ